MESIFGYWHPLVIILVLQFLLFWCRGSCTSSNATILTSNIETIDVNVSYNPYTLVDEEAGIQIRILGLRLRDNTYLHSVNATLRVGTTEARCMMVFVEDLDDAVVTASNPISGQGTANRFIEMNLDTFRNEATRSLSVNNYSEVFGTPLNSVMIALVSTAPCLVDENKFSANVSVQESQSNEEFSASDDGINDLSVPLAIDLQLLSDFSTWALQLQQNSTDHTAMLTRTSLRPTQTPTQGQPPLPSPDESLHRIIITVVVGIVVIVAIITVFVAVVIRRKCCPKNRNKHTRRHGGNLNVPPAHDHIDETFQAMQNAAYNTRARDDTSRLHRPAQLPRHSRQRLGNVSYHIYEEIPGSPSEIVVQTESTGSQNGNRREVRVQRSLSESQMYATAYRRNRLTLQVPTRATSESGSTSASGAYVTPDDQVPMTAAAAAALSKILLKAPEASTVRQPVSQDTIPEEELELDEEDGMDPDIQNEYLSLCQ